MLTINRCPLQDKFESEVAEITEQKNGLSADEQLLLTVAFHIAPSLIHGHPPRSRRILRCAMAHLYRWPSKRSWDVLAGLIDRQVLFEDSEGRLSLTAIATGKQPKSIGICRNCGNSRVVTRDHVLPKSRGGINRPENIVQTCKLSNTSKRDRTPEQWARDILACRYP